MTASALVNAIEQGIAEQATNKHRYWIFAELFARLFRSQFIAFVGNVLMAFPMSLFLVWAIQQLFQVNIASAKWLHLVNDLNPIKTPWSCMPLLQVFFYFFPELLPAVFQIGTSITLYIIVFRNTPC
jgi:site-specific recombinase